MSDPLVLIDRVSYLYPNATTHALYNISLTIHKGEFLGLIGPTGAGKTTLCLALMGIVPQFYRGRFFGHITVAGLDTLEYPISSLAHHVGIVFQDPESQLITTSVENEIAFALENLCLPRAEIRQRITHALSVVRMKGTEQKHPNELSGGQKQRLAIALALAMQPQILVLDEPTSQLDPVGTAEVFTTLHRLNTQLGITVILASHASEEMATFAHRIALLNAGYLIEVSPPDTLFPNLELMQRYHLRPPQVAHTFALINQHNGMNSQVPVRLDAGIQALGNLHSWHRPYLTTKRSSLDPPTSPPLLEVSNLHYAYADGTQALQGVSLTIRRGEYVLIVGQNGAGKSTLIKLAVGLLTPTAGSIALQGRAISTLSAHGLAGQIGLVAQNPDNQLFQATVEDEVAFALRHLNYAVADIEQRTTTSLELVGLLEQRHKHPLVLSKGERTRVVLAAVLAMQPDMIILDEPTSGQDWQGALSILDLSRTLHQIGTTIVLITHHLYLMPGYAERVIVMGKGTILLDAPIREVYHATELLRSTFITPPQAVLLAQELERLEQHPFPLLTPQEVAACFSHAPQVS